LALLIGTTALVFFSLAEYRIAEIRVTDFFRLSVSVLVQFMPDGFA
jgi:hypothetical protein